MGTINADFSGETAVVTGASSGIGRAVANGFGDAGATVINADVRAAPKDLDAEAPTHEAIEDRGGTAVFVETDVSDPTQIESVIEAAGEFGGVDVMVNNAGVHRSAEFLDVTPEDFDFVHGVNLKGAFFGTQLAAQDMIDRGVEGTIVNTSSTTAERAEWNPLTTRRRRAAYRCSPEVRRSNSRQARDQGERGRSGTDRHRNPGGLVRRGA